MWIDSKESNSGLISVMGFLWSYCSQPNLCYCFVVHLKKTDLSYVMTQRA
jgi:hypothetical protein